MEITIFLPFGDFQIGIAKILKMKCAGGIIPLKIVL